MNAPYAQWLSKHSGQIYLPRARIRLRISAGGRKWRGETKTKTNRQHSWFLFCLPVFILRGTKSSNHCEILLVTRDVWTQSHVFNFSPLMWYFRDSLPFLLSWGALADWVRRDSIWARAPLAKEKKIEKNIVYSFSVSLFFLASSILGLFFTPLRALDSRDRA